MANASVRPGRIRLASVFILALSALSTADADVLRLAGAPRWVRAGFDASWLAAPLDMNAWKAVGDADVSFPERDRPSDRGPFTENPPSEFTVVVPLNLDAGIIERTLCPALLVDRIGENWEVYANGHLVTPPLSLSPGAPLVKHVRHRPFVPLARDMLAPGMNIFAFRILGDPYAFYTGVSLREHSFFGDCAALERERAQTLSVGLLSVYATIAALVFILYLMDRQRRENLLFALFVFFYCLFMFGSLHISEEIVPDSMTHYRVFQNGALFMAAGFILAFLQLSTNTTPLGRRIAVVFPVFYSIFALVALALPIKTFRLQHSIFVFSELAFVCYVLGYGIIVKSALVFIGILRRAPQPPLRRLRLALSAVFTSPSGMLLAATLITFTAAIFDVIATLATGFSGHLTNVALLSYLAAQVWILFVQFNRIRRQSIESAERGKAARAIAVLKERQRIYSDIHDHLGARATDLHFLIKRLKPGEALLSDTLEKLKQGIEDVVHSLRNRLYQLEEYDLCRREFCEGIQLLAVRRYSYAGRTVRFAFGDSSAVNSAMQTAGEGMLDRMIQVVGETITNDLKHGSGESRFEIWMEHARSIQVRFEALTKVTADGDVAIAQGMGAASIRERVREMGGQLHAAPARGSFHMQISIPVGNAAEN